jgi:putative ABC transport system permease protein
LIRQHRAARGLLDALLGLVAFATFALGAVGMLTISWQGVAERSREIAIRRAVGARQEEILAQFLLEGLVLAGVGGLAGALAGALGSGSASLVGGWPWVLTLRNLALPVALAVLVGALSTFYPACRAAMLDPVAALRLER